jgi:hypothetical protein
MHKSSNFISILKDLKLLTIDKTKLMIKNRFKLIDGRVINIDKYFNDLGTG